MYDNSGKEGELRFSGVRKDGTGWSRKPEEVKWREDLEEDAGLLCSPQILAQSGCAPFKLYQTAESVDGKQGLQ